MIPRHTVVWAVYQLQSKSIRLLQESVFFKIRFNGAFAWIIIQPVTYILNFPSAVVIDLR